MEIGCGEVVMGLFVVSLLGGLAWIEYIAWKQRKRMREHLKRSTPPAQWTRPFDRW